jgi:hypothetical protein
LTLKSVAAIFAAMSKITVGLFLVVYGATCLIETKIPGWLIGLLALVAGAFSLIEALPRKGA